MDIEILNSINYIKWINKKRVTQGGIIFHIKKKNIFSDEHGIQTFTYNLVNSNRYGFGEIIPTDAFSP